MLTRLRYPQHARRGKFCVAGSELGELGCNLQERCSSNGGRRRHSTSARVEVAAFPGALPANVAAILHHTTRRAKHHSTRDLATLDTACRQALEDEQALKTSQEAEHRSATVAVFYARESRWRLTLAASRCMPIQAHAD